jgi:hypothetical protein
MRRDFRSCTSIAHSRSFEGSEFCRRRHVGSKS